ncbi:hypothetical protein JW992_08865, partial [candidate division KSB1 bacterium]|nr:hypothetical protein [candidate division KSB1 bacterium]
LEPVAIVLETQTVESPDHWGQIVCGLDESIDAILPVSITAYPTEVWNSHPQPLIERKLPVLFWCLQEHDEPDFWRWSARDLLRTLGVELYLIADHQEGVERVKALAMRRFMRASRLVVFGEQNFPWNAHAAGAFVKQQLGTEIVVHPLDAFRRLYGSFSDEKIQKTASERLSQRYRIGSVRPDQLGQALRTYLAIRAVLEKEKALGFGVNCFGDLIIHGGRDVPCLAQCLLREDGFIAACDGDFIAMMTMLLVTFFTEQVTLMSNLYPVSYVGALTDHFGDPLAPNPQLYPRENRHNFARLAHCGFVGVISPEMTPDHKVLLNDWGGTYEIKRDGMGCGIDADLIAGQPLTAAELYFDSKRLLLARAQVAETTRHPNMPHCESSALLEFENLPRFVELISREHAVFVYGDHVARLKLLGETLGLACTVV